MNTYRIVIDGVLITNLYQTGQMKDRLRVKHPTITTWCHACGIEPLRTMNGDKIYTEEMLQRLLRYKDRPRNRQGVNLRT